MKGEKKPHDLEGKTWNIPQFVLVRRREQSETCLLGTTD